MGQKEVTTYETSTNVNRSKVGPTPETNLTNNGLLDLLLAPQIDSSYSKESLEPVKPHSQ